MLRGAQPFAMSEPRNAIRAKLVIGLLFNNKALLPHLAGEMETAAGPIDMVSPWMTFDYTDYYTPEMGKPLFRRLLVFKELVAQMDLARIKRTTNELEQTHAVNGKRCVNIDPGYLLLERFVLATGKNYSHRIYIGRGIYADLTLIFQQGTYRPLPWTYPDYADTQMISFLRQVRQRYAADLRMLARPDPKGSEQG